MEVYDEFIKNGFITFELYLKNLNVKSDKILCKFNCIVCQNEEIVTTSILGKRTQIKEAVCRKCSHNWMVKQSWCIEKNSEAQKKFNQRQNKN